MPGHVQSVERAAAILKLLVSSPDGIGVSDLARSLSLAKPTVHGLLRTLHHVGFVAQDPVTGRYRLGPGLRDLSGGHIDLNELRSRCLNWADPLAAHSGEAVRIGALREGAVVVVHHVFRPYDTQQTLDVGDRLPPHATALGKVLLAYDARAASQVMTRPLEMFTRRTLVRPEALRRGLVELWTAGWGAEVEEHEVGRAAVAAPIRGYGGLVVGAIGLSGEVERVCDAQLRPRRALVALVCETARAISRELGTVRG